MQTNKHKVFKNTDRRCNGCNYNSYACLLRHDKDTIDLCKCKNCIVKSMCQQTCIERINIFKSLPGLKRQLLVDIQNIEIYRDIKVTQGYSKLVIEPNKYPDSSFQFNEKNTNPFLIVLRILILSFCTGIVYELLRRFI